MSLMVIDPYRFAGGTPTDTGFVIAGAGATVNTGGEAWSNPGNITADDAAVAQIEAATGAQSDDLKGSSFGFSIPGGATIDGIEIQVEANADGGVETEITYINVGKDDSTLGTALTPTQVLTDTPTLYTFGGAASLFGLSWTPAEINASTFQARLRASPDADDLLIVYIDAMWIKIYYTT